MYSFFALGIDMIASHLKKQENKNVCANIWINKETFF